MKTILVVEDELAQLFKQIIALSAAGRYQVENAETGSEAVRKARVLNPDLIIMDLHLPKISGLEAIKRIRRFNETVPILSVTAYNDRFSRQAAIQAGANEYLTKPFDIPDLLQKIAELLKRTVSE